MLQKVSRGFWTSPNNQREFLLNFAKLKGFDWKNPNNWGKITQKEIRNAGGGGLFIYYSSFWDILQNNFPEIPWSPLTTNVKLPPKYWQNKENQRKYCDQLAKKFAIDPSNAMEWKKISASNFIENKGKGLLQQYPSIGDALISVYSDYNWEINDVRDKKPAGYWTLKENQSKFLIELYEKLYPNDKNKNWTKISLEDIKKHGGSLILQEYNSYLHCITTLFPNVNEKEIWINSQNNISAKYWDNLSNQRDFLLKIKEIYNIKDTKDWKKITRNNIIEHKGSGLLRKYSSVFECLKANFPDENWDYLHPRVSDGWWDNYENRREFFDSFAKKEKIETMNDWSKIKKQQFIDIGAGSLFSKFNSIYEILSNTYPEKNWIISQIRKPISFWDSQKNQREFFIQIQNELKLNDISELIKLTNSQIAQFGGSNLLRKYTSLKDCLNTLFPSHNWLEWNDRRITRSDYWKNIENQRKFLHYFAEKRGINTISQWKNVNACEISKFGGSGILKLYPNWADALSTILNLDSDLPVRNFRNRVSYNYWKNPERIKEFVKQCEKEFFITDTSQWYRISLENLYSILGGFSLIKEFGLFEILKLAYPDVKWDKKKLMKSDKRSKQWQIFNLIKQIYPNDEVIEEFNHPLLTRISSKPIEFDIYIPDKNIAFEYHGKHHYEDLPAFGPAELYQIRDEEKEKLCKDNNIPLVIIPYWFTGDKQTLIEWINKINKTTSTECIKE